MRTMSLRLNDGAVSNDGRLVFWLVALFDVPKGVRERPLLGPTIFGRRRSVSSAAIRRRDKEAGKVWMRRHVEDWRRGFERAGNSLDRPVERMYMEHALVGRKR